MDAIIIDIDGTISNLDHRLHHIKKQPKDYDSFNRGLLGDSPIPNIVWLVDLLVTAHYEGNGHPALFVCSGRPEAVRETTEQWLKTHVPRLYECVDEILLRSDKDSSPDTEVKYDMLMSIRERGYNVRLALEDKPNVCNMWRNNGVTVLQVDSGSIYSYAEVY